MDIPIGQYDIGQPTYSRPFARMPLDDAAESVWVAPSCTLWLYEHFLSDSPGPAAIGIASPHTGSWHAWNHLSSERESLTNDFSEVGMSNKASSYRCECGLY